MAITWKERAALHTCTLCGREYPGAHFIVRAKVPPIEGTKPRLVTKGEDKGEVKVYSRTEWGKTVLDPSRPCRACRARTNAIDSYRKRKARIEANKEKEIARRIKEGIEVTPDLFPSTPRVVKGYDPCLEAVRIARMGAAKALAEAKLAAANHATSVAPLIRKAELVTQRHESKEGVAVHPFYVWLIRLLEARIAVYESVREQRKIDMKNVILRDDTRRHHMLFYISTEDRTTLDWIADKVNFYRPPSPGPRYSGLSVISIPRLDKIENGTDTRGDILIADAWKPFAKALSACIAASNAAMRNRHSHPSRRKPPRWLCEAAGVESFTMEDFMLKRRAAAEAARKQLDRALVMREHPAAWPDPWDDNKPRALRTWRYLVPPMLRDELTAMWNALPETRRKHCLAFPMNTGEKRTRFQSAHGLDARNVPLPDSVEKHIVVPVPPSPKKGRHQFVDEEGK